MTDRLSASPLRPARHPCRPYAAPNSSGTETIATGRAASRSDQGIDPELERGPHAPLGRRVPARALRAKFSLKVRALRNVCHIQGLAATQGRAAQLLDLEARGGGQREARTGEWGRGACTAPAPPSDCLRVRPGCWRGSRPAARSARPGAGARFRAARRLWLPRGQGWAATPSSQRSQRWSTIESRGSTCAPGSSSSHPYSGSPHAGQALTRPRARPRARGGAQELARVERLRRRQPALARETGRSAAERPLDGRPGGEPIRVVAADGSRPALRALTGLADDREAGHLRRLSSLGPSGRRWIRRRQRPAQRGSHGQLKGGEDQRGDSGHKRQRDPPSRR